MSEFHDGATWLYHADITNDGSNSGNHVYTIVPGEGVEFELMYASIFNGDAATRNVHMRTDDGTNQGPYVAPIQALTAGAYYPVPVEDTHTSNAGLSSGARFIFSGIMRLVATVEAVAVSEDSALYLACRLRSSLPVVTLTSPTDAVEVVNVNRVM